MGRRFAGACFGGIEPWSACMFGRKPGRPPGPGGGRGPAKPGGRSSGGPGKPRPRGPSGPAFPGRGTRRGPTLQAGSSPAQSPPPPASAAPEGTDVTDSEIPIVEAGPYEDEEAVAGFGMLWDEAAETGPVHAPVPAPAPDSPEVLESIELEGDGASFEVGPEHYESVGVETARSAPLSQDPVQVAAVVDALYSGRDAFFRYVRRVGDLMEPPSGAFGVNQCLRDVLDASMQAPGGNIVVVEQQVRRQGDAPAPRHFCGFVSNRLIRRLLPYRVGLQGSVEPNEMLLRQSLGAYAELCAPPPAIRPYTPILEAVDRLWEEGADVLPVVQPVSESESEFVGLLSRERVISCFLRMETLRRLRNVRARGPRIMDAMRGEGGGVPTEVLLDSVVVQVSDVMREHVPVVAAEAALSDAIAIMQSERLRALPVVDNGALIGMVSDTDIVTALPPPEISFLQGLPAREPRFLDHLFLLDPADGDLSQALSHRVTSVMQQNPIAETSDSRWVDAAEVLYSEDSPGRALPVVGETEDAVQGLITEREILGVILAVGGMA